MLWKTGHLLENRMQPTPNQSTTAVVMEQSSHASSSIVKSETLSPPQQHTSNFGCEYCGEDFNLKQYFIDHLLENHGDSTMSDCVKPEQSPIQSISPEPVEPSDNFMYGVRSSSSESVESKNRGINCTGDIVLSDPKPFSCDVCQKTFNQKYNLKKHMIVHSGAKPYSCEICQKTFTRKSSVKEHMH
eukprot:710630_1